MSEAASERLLFEQHGDDTILRVWEIDSNSTRFDRLASAPSDGDLVLMWSIWSGINLVVGTLTLTIIVSMLLAPPKVRRNAFNTYLFFLVIPDFVFSFCCCFTCLLNAIYGHYVSEWMCQVQHYYLVFGVGANAWLNATVALQLYRLLRKSRFPQFKLQYKAPTYKEATQQALCVYAYVLTLAAVFYIPSKQSHMEIASHKGMFCFAGEVDQRSSRFFWIGFMPMLVLVPLAIVIWTYIQVQRHSYYPRLVDVVR